MSVNKSDKSKLWDQKSSKYPRFDGALTPFGEQVFDYLSQWDVNFDNKSVLDVGCGTGVYTLFIAQKCSEILGVDSSGGMLEILKEDASKFGIKNLSTQLATFDEFNAQKHYDIALCTMSPAIKTDANFAKFHACATQKIYLNFAATRHSTLLAPFFEHFNVTPQSGSSAAGLEVWLKSQNINYKKQNLSEIRVAKRNKDEALQNICWHLEINGVNADMNEVVRIYDELKFGESVSEEISSLMSLFVF